MKSAEEGSSAKFELILHLTLASQRSFLQKINDPKGLNVITTCFNQVTKQATEYLHVLNSH